MGQAGDKTVQAEWRFDLCSLNLRNVCVRQRLNKLVNVGLMYCKVLCKACGDFCWTIPLGQWPAGDRESW